MLPPFCRLATLLPPAPRCESVLHCCLHNGGSPAILRFVLFELPRLGYPASKLPDIRGVDLHGHSALEIAMATRQWGAVRLLVRAGALQARCEVQDGITRFCTHVRHVLGSEKRPC